MLTKREMNSISSFSKNYERRFRGTSLFDNIFIKILEIAEENGLIAPEQIYIFNTYKS
ncbi:MULTISPECIES: hypothetical protein [Clostridium]|uniref:Uncharacterized protein n=1 Tax=Clostridium nitritogenes TaxID=83340 RepID=A0ABN1LIN3_9CLOT|nr:hypothetical protein [Clostridium baratii]MBT9832924.1 hypothetical protein [Clostridium baratii]MDU1855961.1 hypothetical protein [Clostridium baratii]